MYDFIDLTKLGIFLNSFISAIILFFFAIKKITLALDLLKSSE
ncbi:hypothetical protein HMPREF1139_1478 [Campylobacter sp. FOBRC14]|nr:hypothetical protein HMPREF1139_1478 [Campylobacter sp. FOBRC14]